MKPSWNFITAFAAAFFLVFGLTVAGFCLNLGVRSNSSQWAFDINEKKMRLAAQTGSPKLLLVGGSATLFGVSAREIQNQTGFRTINLGTHASLGTSYILYLAQEAAKPGDTVLLAGKGHEGSIIVGEEKLPWDEAGAARDALREIGFAA